MMITIVVVELPDPPEPVLPPSLTWWASAVWIASEQLLYCDVDADMIDSAFFS